MENNNDNIYSGSLNEGWNFDGTFSRIQYYTEEEIKLITDLKNMVNQGIKYLDNQDIKTRLDIRCKLSKDIVLSLHELEKDFGNIDISIKEYGSDDSIYLLIGKNKESREVDNNEIEKIKDFVVSKVNDTLEYIDSMNGFEDFALYHLDKINKNGYLFEKNNFEADEVMVLWGNNFGWNLEEIKDLLSTLNDSTKCLYGLRDSEGCLLSLVLIIDGETTEWSTDEKYQGKKLIEPLLIFANSDQIDKIGKEELKIYVHARYNRSISPAIKSGMKFNLDSGLQNLLTNHVEVEGEMQTFIEGVLEPQMYSDAIIKSYLTN